MTKRDFILSLINHEQCRNKSNALWNLKKSLEQLGSLFYWNTKIAVIVQTNTDPLKEPSKTDGYNVLIYANDNEKKFVRQLKDICARLDALIISNLTFAEMFPEEYKQDVDKLYSDARSYLKRVLN